MLAEPAVKRTVVFFDGQNLFHHARAAFGHYFPNYSPLALATRICGDNGFNLHEIRFYTGIPSVDDDSFWNHFWSAKLLAMSRAGIKTFSRPLRYRRKTIQLSDGIDYTAVVGEEKGVQKTDWIRIDRATYDTCLDPRDYRRKSARK